MQTLLLPSDRKSGILHRKEPLQMLYIMNLTCIFNVTNFEMWISRKIWEQAKNVHVWLLYSLIFAIERDQCECCTSWPWPTFSRSIIFLLCICNKKIAQAMDVPGRFSSTPAMDLLFFGTSRCTLVPSPHTNETLARAQSTEPKLVSNTRCKPFARGHSCLWYKSRFFKSI